MKSAFYVTAILMTTGLIGCQKFESSQSQTQQPAPVTAADLQGKSPSEVVQLKYASLVLNCGLRLHYGKTFDAGAISPIASLQLDLGDAAKRSEKPTMTGNSADQTTTVEVTLKDFVVENDTSITAEVLMSSNVQGVSEFGIANDETRDHKQSFRENVATTVFSEKEPSDDDAFYFRQVDCTLQAKMR